MKFYEDPEYIKMCEKATEIQEQYGNFDTEHQFIVGSECRRVRTEDNEFYYNCCNN